MLSTDDTINLRLPDRVWFHKIVFLSSTEYTSKSEIPICLSIGRLKCPYVNIKTLTIIIVAFGKCIPNPTV